MGAHAAGDGPCVAGDHPAVDAGLVGVNTGLLSAMQTFAKLIIHEHPQYQGPIILDVLPEELGELP
jgi:hypothetical protein